MSTLSYSTWHSDEGAASSSPSKANGGATTLSRKRVSTMGGVIHNLRNKTIRNRGDTSAAKAAATSATNSEPQPTNAFWPSSTVYEHGAADEEVHSATAEVETFEETQERQAARSAHVHHLLDKLTGFPDGSSAGRGTELGEFNPMPYPPVRRMPKISADEPLPSADAAGNHPLMPKTRAVLKGADKYQPANHLYYRPAAAPTSSSYSNYRDAFNREGMTGSGTLGETAKPAGAGPSSSSSSPYYAALGGSSSDPLVQKLNYITHMLENMQMEKTHHVTEEFVLYCLLGVFMIYVVDGFSRGGKYIR